MAYNTLQGLARWGANPELIAGLGMRPGTRQPTGGIGTLPILGGQENVVPGSQFPPGTLAGPQTPPSGPPPWLNQIPQSMIDWGRAQGYTGVPTSPQEGRERVRAYLQSQQPGIEPGLAPPPTFVPPPHFIGPPIQPPGAPPPPGGVPYAEQASAFAASPMAMRAMPHLYREQRPWADWSQPERDTFSRYFTEHLGRFNR